MMQVVLFYLVIAELEFVLSHGIGRLGLKPYGMGCTWMGSLF